MRPMVGCCGCAPLPHLAEGCVIVHTISMEAHEFALLACQKLTQPSAMFFSRALLTAVAAAAGKGKSLGHGPASTATGAKRLGLAAVHSIVAVSSAKGGVGKSTTAGAPGGLQSWHTYLKTHRSSMIS